VNPKTGRHHQIRVQLARMGCVIKGDLKYGASRSNSDASIHLHARELKFEHPVKKTPMKLMARVPKESLWQTFEEMGH
jgi:23S rRNA pseudouridine1911/1915/1917 synthase